jgi:ribulose-5-phosphate 4-epimerase/fuculose-1-phosphate aldolase
LLILRNHGLLACGRTIPEMFLNMWLLQRACEIQVATDATGKPNIPISEEIGEKSEALLKIQMAGNPTGELEFNAMVRKVDQIDSSYKD